MEKFHISKNFGWKLIFNAKNINSLYWNVKSALSFKVLN